MTRPSAAAYVLSTLPDEALTALSRWMDAHPGWQISSMGTKDEGVLTLRVSVVHPYDSERYEYVIGYVAGEWVLWDARFHERKNLNDAVILVEQRGTLFFWRSRRAGASSSASCRSRSVWAAISDAAMEAMPVNYAHPSMGDD